MILPRIHHSHHNNVNSSYLNTYFIQVVQTWSTDKVILHYLKHALNGYSITILMWSDQQKYDYLLSYIEHNRIIFKEYFNKKTIISFDSIIQLWYISFSEGILLHSFGFYFNKKPSREAWSVLSPQLRSQKLSRVFSWIPVVRYLLFDLIYVSMYLLRLIIA